ncbi:MAG TPA: hypothetical protein PL187_11145 [Caldilinea sp.]|nr:hypothetical protein [Caldilinea sp.]
MADNEFTFPNGRKVIITRVSPLTLQSVERSLPRPTPPVQQTDLGPEPNFAHPDYVQAVGEWSRKINERSLDTMILFGVDAEIDSVALQKARDKAKLLGLELPENDLLCYVKHVCIGSLDDLTRLRTKILDTSLPTEEKIGEAAEGFKSPVAGQADPQNEGSE